MSDLADRIRTAGEQVDAGYDVRRTEAVLDGLRAKLRRRRARRLALGSALGILCALAGAFVAVHHRRESPTLATAVNRAALFSLSDGSLVTSMDPSSRLLAKVVSPRLVELELLAGAAHFEVTPNREREFRVRAGRVGVVVVGTKFSVTRQGDLSVVSVQQGSVRVEWERGQQLLHAGERGSFPPFETTAEPAPAREEETPGSEPSMPSVEPPAAQTRPAADWRALANRGDFTAASTSGQLTNCRRRGARPVAVAVVASSTSKPIGT